MQYITETLESKVYYMLWFIIWLIKVMFNPSRSIWFITNSKSNDSDSFFRSMWTAEGLPSSLTLTSSSGAWLMKQNHDLTVCGHLIISFTGALALVSPVSANCARLPSSHVLCWKPVNGLIIVNDESLMQCQWRQHSHTCVSLPCTELLTSFWTHCTELNEVS